MSIMDLASGLLSAGSGGLFGGLMAIGTSFLKSREAKADHKRKMELMEFQLEAADRGHLNSLETIRQMGSAAGMVASIEADTIQNLPQWASALKALFRPFLTISLVAISAYIFTLLLASLTTETALSQLLSQEEMVELLRYTVMSLVFSAATAVTWWFGERGLTPPRSK